MSNKDIGIKIKRLREANGLTQAKLATELGYKSNAVISKLENGESELTASQIKKITTYFNITTDFLLTGKEIAKIDNKSLQVTKTVKVKKSLSFFKRNDFIMIAIAFIMIIFAMIFKNDLRNYTLVVLMIYNLILLIYLIINKVFRSRANTDVINIPLKKNITYYSSLDDQMIKKYKKNSMVSGLVVIFTNIIFYGIIINTITEALDVMPYTLVISLLLIVIFKSVTFVLSSKFLEVDMTFLLTVILIIELMLTTLYLLYLNMYDILAPQLILTSTLNLLVFLVVITINDMFLKKYNYKIE